jgi:hypothetical protein
VAVPVDLDVLTGSLHDSAHVLEERAHAHRRRVPDRVGDDDALRPGLDRAGVELLEHGGFGPRRVLGHVAHGHAVLDAESDRFLRKAEDALVVPSFRVRSDGRRSDERASLDRYPHPLAELDHRLDLAEDRPNGDVR